MKTSEEKVQKIIDDADEAFYKPGYSISNRQYLRENARCEFLKVHLKAALETIEHMKVTEETNKEFYDKLLAQKK